ncbi:hypothetical protein GCM10027046_25140 [Uliginosibacterium flavum]|uniref:Phage tail tape measure protein n=1 Tax=Uliginosibacterium flavum TaxID=1396831 RepID=A0ABV2TLM9_9RHOO
MNRRRMMRSLRKEMLVLQAEQYRLALRQDLGSLNLASSVSGKAQSAWLETLAGVLGAVLPARWGRWLNAGLSAWRIAKQVMGKVDSAKAI